jgi:hypothetical protein
MSDEVFLFSLCTFDCAAHRRVCTPPRVRILAGRRPRTCPTAPRPPTKGLPSLLTTATSRAGTNKYLDYNYQRSDRFDEMADGLAIGVRLLMLLTGRPAVDENGEDVIGLCDGLMSVI